MDDFYTSLIQPSEKECPCPVKFYSGHMNFQVIFGTICRTLCKGHRHMFLGPASVWTPLHVVVVKHERGRPVEEVVASWCTAGITVPHHQPQPCLIVAWDSFEMVENEHVRGIHTGIMQRATLY